MGAHINLGLCLNFIGYGVMPEMKKAYELINVDALLWRELDVQVDVVIDGLFHITSPSELIWRFHAQELPQGRRSLTIFKNLYKDRTFSPGELVQ